MGQESLGQVPDSWRPPSGVRVRVTDDVLSDIVSTSVLILINTYYKADPANFETWIDWIHRTTKEKSHETIDQLWRWLCQAYSLLAKQPMDSYTL
jgi:hypothetical protein